MNFPAFCVRPDSESYVLKIFISWITRMFKENVTMPQFCVWYLYTLFTISEWDNLMRKTLFTISATFFSHRVVSFWDCKQNVEVPDTKLWNCDIFFKHSCNLWNKDLKNIWLWIRSVEQFVVADTEGGKFQLDFFLLLEAQVWFNRLESL